MTNRWGNNGNSDRLYFLGLQNHCRWWLQPWNSKTLDPRKKSYDKPRQHTKKQRHYFTDKGPSSQRYGFSSSHVWMWELDQKESWGLKNWCFWTVVLGKTLESPLNCKEIQPVHLKGDQSWIFIGRTDAEAEAPILWSPHVKNWLTGKDPDAGKDWRWEKKGTTQDEMVGWHQWLDGHEFEQALGVGDGQGSLECCSPWGRKELDVTEWLKWSEVLDWLTDLNQGHACVWTLLIKQPLGWSTDCFRWIAHGGHAQLWCCFLRYASSTLCSLFPRNDRSLTEIRAFHWITEFYHECRLCPGQPEAGNPSPAVSSAWEIMVPLSVLWKFTSFSGNSDLTSTSSCFLVGRFVTDTCAPVKNINSFSELPTKSSVNKQINKCIKLLPSLASSTFPGPVPLDAVGA